MSNNFINRKPNRLNSFDYSQSGFYFITLSTKDNIDFFGNVNNGKIILTEKGVFARECWSAISNHYGNVEIDVFTIMPNHIHGILIIKEEDIKNLSENKLVQNEKNKNSYGQISKIINSYKNIVTKHIRYKLKDVTFGWHRSFYDHVIRNQQSLDKIREYICNNPLQLFLNKKILKEL